MLQAHSVPLSVAVIKVNYYRLQAAAWNCDSRSPEVHVLMWRTVQTLQESTNQKSLNYQRHCAFTIHLKLMTIVASLNVKRSAMVVLKTAHLNGEGFYPIYRQ